MLLGHRLGRGGCFEFGLRYLGASPSKKITAIDDPRSDEIKEHSACMGRWKRDTVETVQDTSWWTVIEIVDRSQEPLFHHMCGMEQSGQITQESALCKLICERGHRIFEEFENPFVVEDWCRHIVASPTLSRFADHLIELQVLLSLHHAAGYYRRVIQNIDSFLGRRVVIAKLVTFGVHSSIQGAVNSRDI